MKKWSHDTEINASIDQVWKLLYGTLADMQKIMPNVVENRPIKETEEVVGSIHRQKHDAGKRIQEYDLETLAFKDTPEQKELKERFTVSSLFEITTLYELTKIDDNKTHFKYTTTNKPLKWFLKLLVGLGSNKVVIQFVDRVKEVAEKETEKSCSS